jgi:hypothetical protein
MFNPECIKVEFVPAEGLEAAYSRRLESYLDTLGRRHEATDDAAARQAIETQAKAVQDEYAAQRPALDAIAAQPKGTQLFFIELGSERRKSVPEGAFAGRADFHDLPMESLGVRYVVAPITDENTKILADANALGEDMVRSWTRRKEGHAAALEKEGASAGPTVVM